MTTRSRSKSKEAGLGPGPLGPIKARQEAAENASADEAEGRDESQKKAPRRRAAAAAAADRTPRYNPVDSGWSWVILLSASVCQFVCAGLMRSFGVLFVAIQSRFRSSASMIAALGSVESISFSLTGLVCMFVMLEVVSVRRVTLLGALVGMGGLVGGYLATDIRLLFLCFSVCIGVSFGLILGPGFVLLNAYFRRKLPLATAVCNTGGSIGSVVMPIATRMLVDEYFLSGAFLFWGAFYAQMLVFGSLLTPPEEYQPRSFSSREKTSSSSSSSSAAAEEGAADQQWRLLAKRKRQERSQNRAVSESEVIGGTQDQHVITNSGCQKPLTQSLLSINERKVSKNGLHTAATPSRGLRGSSSINTLILSAGVGGSSAVSLSTLDLDSTSASFVITDSGLLHSISSKNNIVEKVERVSTVCDDSSTEDEDEYDSEEDGDFSSSGCSCRTVAEKLSSFADPVLFRSTVFWLLAAYHYLGGLVAGLPAAYLPALAQEKGLTPTQGALLLTVAGGLDVVSKLVPGLLTQFHLLKPRTSVLVALVCLGTVFQLTGLADGMLPMTLVAVVYGLFSGVFFSAIPLVILEFCPVTSFRQVLGFTQLSLGICGVTGFVIIGYLKDRSGSYVTSFHFMGAAGLLAAVLLFILPFLHKHQASSETRKVEAPNNKRDKDNSE